MPRTTSIQADPMELEASRNVNLDDYYKPAVR